MTTGLRERKKAATRQALHEAAVRLCLADGIENVTVEAIADAAGVSRRTFSNYFTGKEQALLHRDRTHVARLVELVRARPADEAPLTALVRAAEQRGTEHSEGAADEERYRSLRQDPVLLTALAATYLAIEDDLAAAVEERLPAGPDGPLRARTLAAAFLAVLRVVAQTAVEDTGRDMAELMRVAATTLTHQDPG